MIRITFLYFFILVLGYAQTELQVEKYTLDIGFTVILNTDIYASNVFGGVAIKGGGKQDPADATGIAHYLEHMLFKGTDKLGTVDYESEKVYLDSIEYLYDELGREFDESKRNSLQEKINTLNVIASDFAIPNKFDRLAEGFGSTGVNAFTSNDILLMLAHSSSSDA